MEKMIHNTTSTYIFNDEKSYLEVPKQKSAILFFILFCVNGDTVIDAQLLCYHSVHDIANLKGLLSSYINVGIHKVPLDSLTEYPTLVP